MKGFLFGSYRSHQHKIMEPTARLEARLLPKSYVSLYDPTWSLGIEVRLCPKTASLGQLVS